MSQQWSRRCQSSRDREPQIKGERFLQETTRCRFLPSYVRLAPTHPPLKIPTSPAHDPRLYIHSRRYVHMHTQTVAPREQQQAATFYFSPPPPLLILFLFPPQGSASSFLVLSSSWQRIILLRLCSRKQRPDGHRIYQDSRFHHVLSFSSLATFWRRCFDQNSLSEGETAGDKTNFKRAERELCSHLAKRKRWTKRVKWAVWIVSIRVSLILKSLTRPISNIEVEKMPWKKK